MLEKLLFQNYITTCTNCDIIMQASSYATCRFMIFQFVTPDQFLGMKKGLDFNKDIYVYRDKCSKIFKIRCYPRLIVPMP